jgi:hypothetical protein
MLNAYWFPTESLSCWIWIQVDLWENRAQQLLARPQLQFDTPEWEFSRSTVPPIEHVKAQILSIKQLRLVIFWTAKSVS